MTSSLVALIEMQFGEPVSIITLSDDSPDEGARTWS